MAESPFEHRTLRLRTCLTTLLFVLCLFCGIIPQIIESSLLNLWRKDWEMSGQPAIARSESVENIVELVPDLQGYLSCDEDLGEEMNTDEPDDELEEPFDTGSILKARLSKIHPVYEINQTMPANGSTLTGDIANSVPDELVDFEWLVRGPQSANEFNVEYQIPLQLMAVHLGDDNVLGAYELILESAKLPASQSYLEVFGFIVIGTAEKDVRCVKVRFRLKNGGGILGRGVTLEFYSPKPFK